MAVLIVMSVVKIRKNSAIIPILLDKLEIERAALGGRVFDILGEAFDNISLKDLLIDAIRYGERADVKARLDQVIRQHGKPMADLIHPGHPLMQAITDLQQ